MINSGSDAPGAAACAGSHCWGLATGQMGWLGEDRAAVAGVTHRCHSPQWVTDKPCCGGPLWCPSWHWQQQELLRAGSPSAIPPSQTSHGALERVSQIERLAVSTS